MDIDNKKYPLPKRFRHHTAPNYYFPWEEQKEKPKHYPPLYQELNWAEVFLNKKKPDVIDIGCGKGKLLLDYSEEHQENNVLGIEVRSVAVNWINGIINGENLQNVSVIWYSVVNGLPFIETNSIERIFYLFPDPWFKHKHQKRRAFNEKTILEFHRVLKFNGKLFLATDVSEIDKYQKKLLSKFNKFDFEYITENKSWGLPITNKEKFCKKENIDYVRVVCTKK